MDWTDNLSEAELRESYRLWREAKEEIGELPSLTFDEWLIMEKEISD